MDVTHIDVTVRNPADPTRSWEGRFLVDADAIDSLVPRSRLEAIGIRPEGQAPLFGVRGVGRHCVGKIS